jgi:hypothetical protein
MLVKYVSIDGIPQSFVFFRFVDIIVITVHDRFWNVGQANCILKYFENMMIDHSGIPPFSRKWPILPRKYMQRNYMLSLMNEKLMLLLRKTWKMRWKSRADALYTFKTSYRVVVHALKHLQNQGDDKAEQFLASIMQFQLS